MAANTRVSGAQRIEMWSEAEREIKKYAHDHFLWHKHIHNVELDPIQLLKCEDMDNHRMTLDFSSRRMGKTAIKELYFLKELATKGDQELGIVAPREAQSQVNLSYHQDAIRRSDVLSAYVNVKQGRRQLADTYYQFANNSKAACYGIMANVDGGDLTAASLEEVDDMPHDRLFSRFLLMLGSARRLGASKSAENKPQVRITGVFKGADTLLEMIRSGEYYAIGALYGEAGQAMVRRLVDDGWLSASLVNPDQYEYPVPIGNAVIGMEMGLLNREFLMSMRGQLGDDEFTRQLLCVNAASQNLIWSEWLARAVQLGVRIELDPVLPVPDRTYRKRGKVAFGYDHTGHGEKIESSRSSVVVSENVSGFLVPIFARTWPPGTDESVITRDVVTFWRYFRPDAACGDAFGVGLIATVNDLLFEEGLITINRHLIGEGQSSASHWDKWAFAPIPFQGMTKHSMAVSLAAAFSGKRVALPYVQHIAEGDASFDDVKDLQWLYRQLTNIKTAATTKSYASYKMVKRDIGDDLFDAFMASNWALMSGGNDIVTQILLGQVDRQLMLER